MKLFDTIGDKLADNIFNRCTSETKRVMGKIVEDPSVHSAVENYGEACSTTGYWFGVGVTIGSAAVAAGVVYVIDKAQKAYTKRRMIKKAKKWEKVLREEYEKHKDEIDKEDINY